MAWRYDHGYDHKRLNRQFSDLMQREPLARVLIGRLHSKSADAMDLVALADLCEERGFATLARVVRNGMYVKHKGSKMRIRASGRKRR